jgi:hypothetical protein
MEERAALARGRAKLNAIGSRFDTQHMSPQLSALFSFLQNISGNVLSLTSLVEIEANSRSRGYHEREV